MIGEDCSSIGFAIFIAIEHAINGKIHGNLEHTSRKTLACDGDGETKQMIVRRLI